MIALEELLGKLLIAPLCILFNILFVRKGKC